MASSIRRKFFWMLVMMPVVGITIWIVIWFTASSLSNKYLNAWIEREKIIGRNWLCDDRAVHGFPLNFISTCGRVSMTAQARSGYQSLKLQRLDVVYSPFAPRSLRVLLIGPVHFEDSASQSAFDGQWNRFEILLHYPWPSSPAAHANVTNLAINSQPHATEAPFLAAQTLDLTMRSESAGSSSKTLSVTVFGDGISARALDNATKNVQPARLSAVFHISQVEQLLRGDPRSRLDMWNQTKGTLSIKKFVGDKGNLAIEATGRLSLDDQRRPSGHVDMRAAGLTSLMQHLGFPGSGANRSGLLGGLLRRPMPDQIESVQEPGRRFVPLPLTFRDGAVWIGPIKSPILLRPII